MDEALWALGRASGFVALALFTLTFVLGIVTRSGRPLLHLRRFAIQSIHRNVALTALAFLLIHMISLLFDPYAQLRLVDLVFPFIGAYRPLWLGLGTVAFDLVLAVVVTGLLRRRIGRRAFTVVHWCTYLLWPVAIVHAIGTGTDTGGGVGLVAALAALAAGVAAIVWRLLPSYEEFAAEKRKNDAARKH